MASIFSKIIAREIPGHFVYEDEVCVAILDKFPATEGQTLVIPKKEVDYIGDLDDTTYQHIFSVAKRILVVLDTAFETERTCLVVEGFEVPHVHIKLYPMKDNSKPLGTILPSGTMADDETLSKVAEKIRVVLE